MTLYLATSPPPAHRRIQHHLCDRLRIDPEVRREQGRCVPPPTRRRQAVDRVPLPLGGSLPAERMPETTRLLLQIEPPVEPPPPLVVQLAPAGPASQPGGADAGPAIRLADGRPAGGVLVQGAGGFLEIPRVAHQEAQSAPTRGSPLPSRCLGSVRPDAALPIRRSVGPTLRRPATGPPAVGASRRSRVGRAGAPGPPATPARSPRARGSGPVPALRPP